MGPPFDGTTLEGYVDLLYRSAEGLVVVDYKTDQLAGDAELDGKLAVPAAAGGLRAGGAARHRRGGRRRPMLVFCSTQGPATERPVPELAAAMAEVEVLVGLPRSDHPDAPDDESAGQAQLFNDAGYGRLGGDESV